MTQQYQRHPVLKMIGLMSIVIAMIVAALADKAASGTSVTERVIPFTIKLSRSWPVLHDRGLMAGGTGRFAVGIINHSGRPLTMFGTLLVKADGQFGYNQPVLAGPIDGAKAYGRSKVRGLLWKVSIPAHGARIVYFPVRITALARFCLRTVVASLGSRTAAQCYPVG